MIYFFVQIRCPGLNDRIFCKIFSPSAVNRTNSGRPELARNKPLKFWLIILVEIMLIPAGIKIALKLHDEILHAKFLFLRARQVFRQQNLLMA